MSFENIIQSSNQSLVSNEKKDRIKCQNRSDSYKYNLNNEVKQEIRRKSYIESQKKNREQILCRFRSLLSDNELNEVNEDTEVMETEENKSMAAMSCDKYRNQLMLSEWLTEKPSDLAHNWFLVLCPVGKRCLIISNRGQTRAYSRTGRLINSFPSSLPGGNRKQSRGQKHSCIIDCIFSYSEKVFYILDVMAWNGSDFYECETEFRFFWLQSKLSNECPEVRQRTKWNPFEFHVLNHCNCSDQQISQAINQSLQFSSQLDGLLFYHKQTHYTPGVTPLVNWLKLDMVSDVLNIKTNTATLEVSMIE